MSDKPMALTLAICLGIFLAAGVGWCLNLFTVINNLDSGLSLLMLLRLVGIFVAPLGAVLGYVD